MKLLNQLLRGIVIGVAYLIPGVSGGTMMVSMGLYDTLIDCVTHLFSNFRRSVKILWPYVVGMLIGLFVLASVLTWCFTSHPLPTGTAFIGLILGGLSPLMRKIDRRRMNSFAVFVGVALFALVVALALTNPANAYGRVNVTAGSAMLMVVMGVAASATMLIPGVSGSMVLMLLGYYRPVLAALNDLQDAVLGGNLAQAGTQMMLLLPFLAGLLAGFYLLAKLIHTLLSRWPTHTYCAVLGLVAASPIVILLRTSLAGVTAVTILVSIVTFVAGFVLSAWLAKGGEPEPPTGENSAANG